MTSSTLQERLRQHRSVRLATRSLASSRVTQLAGSLLVFITLASMPAAAQSTGTEFCSTQMATTIKNMFTLIQFGGPLIGGLLALGATVTIPLTRRTDRKKEMKQIRNQGLVYGVLVAPLGTAIISFLLNNVVAGGASCGF